MHMPRVFERLWSNRSTNVKFVFSRESVETGDRTALKRLDPCVVYWGPEYAMGSVFHLCP